MTQTNDENNDKKESIVMDKFLLDTIISLNSTLSDLGKDAIEKTDIICDISDNLKGVLYNLKDIKARIDLNESRMNEVKDFLNSLQHQIAELHTYSTVREDSLKDHLKEMKYALQKINSINPQKGIVIEKKEKKKLDLISMFNDMLDFVKNVKSIVFLLFVTFMVITWIFFGQEMSDYILGMIKK